MNVRGKLYGIVMLLIVLCVFMAVMTAEPWYQIGKSSFLQPNNIENLLRRTSLYGILGIGVAFVIMSSGIDLSVGSIVCLAGCLLALFLRVDYQPTPQLPVYRVLAQPRVVLLEGQVTSVKQGDRLRYWRGRRRKTGIGNVTKVETATLAMRAGEPMVPSASSDPTGGAVRDGVESRLFTIIHWDARLDIDDREGQIGHVIPIRSFQPSDSSAAARLVLDGRQTDLRPRDQLQLVHPSRGLKQATLSQIEIDDDQTQITLSRDPGGDVSTEWSAAPLQRQQRMSIPVALASVIAIAILLGWLHGFLVTQVGLQPFVVTLCGLLFYRGISRWLVNDQPVGFGQEYEQSLSWLGSGKWTMGSTDVAGQGGSFGIPYPCFVLVLIAILAAIFLNRTIWGRYLLALGRNEEAARYSGIHTGRITIAAYIVSVVMAAIGGILFALDANSISPSSFGNFFELYAIAAAVLGGCSLRGGEGSILGVIVGTAVMQVLYNLIVLLKISGALEFAVIGIVILLGVIADEMVKRLAASQKS